MKYRVCKPVQYKNVAYFPADYWGVNQQTKAPLPCPITVTPSGANGLDIPVNSTGIIDLPDEIAAALTLGQIAPLDTPDTPNNSGYEMLGKALQSEQVRRGTEDKVTGAGGKEEWKSGAPRQVSPLSTSGTMTVGEGA